MKENKCSSVMDVLPLGMPRCECMFNCAADDERRGRAPNRGSAPCLCR